MSKNTYSVCCQYVINLCSENKITWLDTVDGAADYTYHNDVNCHYSLIDYFLSSPELIAEQNGKVSILLDGDKSSDHL